MLRTAMCLALFVAGTASADKRKTQAAGNEFAGAATAGFSKQCVDNAIGH